MNEDMQLCFEEGYRAYVKSLGQAANPYPKGTPEHKAFAKGWVKALRQCGPTLASRRRPQNGLWRR